MDIFDLQEFLKRQYPEKQVSFAFPPATHRIYELVMTDGKPNPNHHVECNAVQVLIDGKDPYIEKLTAPHRLTISHEQMKIILKEVL